MGRRRMSRTGPSLVTVDSPGSAFGRLSWPAGSGLRASQNQFDQSINVEGESDVGGHAAWIGSGSD